MRSSTMQHRVIVIGLALLTAVFVMLGGLGPVWAQEPEGGAEGTLAALGTSFTYQGRLTDGGSPANGSYDFEFRLYDALDGGAQVGSTITKENVTVTDGHFTVLLDFGANA